MIEKMIENKIYFSYSISGITTSISWRLLFNGEQYGNTCSVILGNKTKSDLNKNLLNVLIQLEKEAKGAFDLLKSNGKKEKTFVKSLLVSTWLLVFDNKEELIDSIAR